MPLSGSSVGQQWNERRRPAGHAAVGRTVAPGLAGRWLGGAWSRRGRSRRRGWASGSSRSWNGSWRRARWRTAGRTSGLARIKTVIGRRFHVSYTVQGVWKLLRRGGWSCRQPIRRAIERDEGAVEVWKKQVWPQVKACWRCSGPGWCSRTRPGCR
nr:winged helix-turn-helix domain-containing protein [Streptomyces sp. TLI_235]